MGKRKKILFKMITFCMILCFSIISVGCIGLSGYEGGEDFNDDDFISGMAVEMYGAKVLYRPDDYDYNTGSGAIEGSENNYYGQYAYQIINDLLRIYGLSTLENVQERLQKFSRENIPYLYDSIRYQVDTVGTVTNAVVVADDGSESEMELTNQFYIVGADPSIAWNWTMQANTSRDDLKAYVYSNPENLDTINGKDYIRIMEGDVSSAISNYYVLGDTFNDALYEDLYLTESESGTPETDYENYSDYVKTLEYVIYCYAIDLEPAQVTVQTNSDGTYTVNIGSFASVDEALLDAKATFEKLGAYVGLVNRQITKIQNWILKNVIGDIAVNADDSFTNYTGIIAYLDESSNVIRYDFSSAQSSTSALGRDYETAVANILAGVCQYVPIGNDHGEDVTIDQRFLASNIMEYGGNMFMIADDSNFPAQGSATGLTQLQPLEYQSVVLMLNDEIYLDGLTVALKYDADLDGTQEGVYDSSKYIDIIVDINYYNYATKERKVLASKQARVYDGPYDENYLNDGDGSAGDGVIAPTDHTSALMFDGLGQVHVGKFNVDIGDGILKTDVGTVGNYTSAPYVSTEALVLVGTTDVRKYYEIVEYGTNPEYDTDELPEGKTYISGRFNPNMFGGSDGSDYIEITYKVIKNAGDTETNYKFYTGIAFIDYSSEYYPY